MVILFTQLLRAELLLIYSLRKVVGLRKEHKLRNVIRLRKVYKLRLT